MKYTICVTQECNLNCEYCYIGKRKAVMPLSVAQKVVDFIFKNTPPDRKIDIGFFGGEPLLEFGLVGSVTQMIEQHSAFDDRRVQISLVTNGTLFDDSIAEFVNTHSIHFCLSCDGPPDVHDLFRRFPNGRGSSRWVEGTIRRAVQAFSAVLVNAVYHPRTYRRLPEVVDYLASLGVTQIYLNADYSAAWSELDAESIFQVYEQVGERYLAFYLQGQPKFISLIDSKIAVILRSGYQPGERCQMGTAELAFAPDGTIYPCERLIGKGTGEHSVGHVDTGLTPRRSLCRVGFRRSLNPECLSCGLKEYCMNWCGCSNYFSTGDYDRPGAFMCASERAAIQVAFAVFQKLNASMGAIFADHLAGLPCANSVNRC